MEVFYQGAGIAARAVGDSRHSDETSPMVNGEAQKGGEWGVPLGEPPSSGVCGRVIGDHICSGFQDLSKQGRKIEKFKFRCQAVIEVSCLLIPGNIGDGLGLEVRQAVPIANFSNKSIGALCDMEKMRQGDIKRPVEIVCVNIGRLNVLNRGQQGGLFFSFGHFLIGFFSEEFRGLNLASQIRHIVNDNEGMPALRGLIPDTFGGGVLNAGLSIGIGTGEKLPMKLRGKCRWGASLKQGFKASGVLGGCQVGIEMSYRLSEHLRFGNAGPFFKAMIPIGDRPILPEYEHSLGKVV